jgi:threonine/homoserine/homoserine lactone efflux protein
VIAFWLIFKGLMAGLAIAAPVGPVNVLCASRTLSKGRASGLLSGFGAASADALYGAIAGFSITFVINFLVREQFWIRTVGGILLVGIGIVYFQKPCTPIRKETNESSHSDYVSTFLLTLTNPTTVLSYLAVLAAMGMAEPRNWWLNFLLVGGIFFGSMSWWVILVMLVDRLRDRFNEAAECWMNRIAGVAIGAFGIVTFALGIARGR